MRIIGRMLTPVIVVLAFLGGWKARSIFAPGSKTPEWAKPKPPASAPASPILLAGVPDVRQSTSYSCGASALQAVLHYYGIEAREDTLMKACKTTYRDGTQPAGIIRAAKERGLKATFREGLSLEDLQAALKRGIPVIADIQAWADKPKPGFSWLKTWEDGHYVIVVGMNETHVFVEDPSLLGCRGRIPRAEFIERWHDYEGAPPYDKKDRAYVQMGIFIESLKKPAPSPSLCPVE